MWGKGFLVEIVEVVARTNRIVKMKEHLPFCRKFRTLVVVDRVV